jgi:transcriptional regulator with XRE-family HTH domain
MAYGQWQPYADAAPARAHLQALSRAGVGWRRAAELAGLSSGAVSRLLFGGPARRPPSRRIRHETAAAILAVEASPAVLRGGALTGAAGTRRRLQALVAIGWSQAELGRRLGMSPSNFGSMLERERVTAATARRARQLYDELRDRPPAERDQHSRIAASIARGLASDRGWPPAAGDDDEIDDPHAGPLQGWQRTERRGAKATEIAEDAAGLERQGCSRQRIAMRHGLSRASLERALCRAAAYRAREHEPIAEAG